MTSSLSTPPGSAATPERAVSPAVGHALALQPLPTGALIDRGFLLYRRYFLQLLLFGALVNSLPFVISLSGALVLEGMDARSFLREPLRYVMLGAGVVLANIISLLFIALMEGAMTRHISDLYLTRQASIRQSMACLKGRWGAVLWTMVLKTILLAPLFALTIVPIVVGVLARSFFTFWLGLLMPLISSILLAPGLILLVRWLLSMQTVMLEGRTGWDAIRRASRLIRYDTGKGFFYWGETRLSLLLLVVLAATLLLGVVSSLPMLFAQVPAMLSGQFSMDSLSVSPLVISLSHVLDFIGRSLVSPLYVLAATLFYYDIRCRREGLDIVMLSQALRGDGDTKLPDPKEEPST